jgi:hypothetical protein
MTTRTVEVSADGGELYWLDSRGRDTAAVVAQDVASGAIRVLAEDPHSDFTGILLDPALDRPIAAVCARERQRWQVLDAAFADTGNGHVACCPRSKFGSTISVPRRVSKGAWWSPDLRELPIR